MIAEKPNGTNETTYQDAKKWYDQERPVYETLAIKLKNLVQELLEIENINYWMVETRAKSLESFEEKFKLKKCTNPRDIEDLTGMRIIGYVISDVDKICSLLMNNFDVDKSKIEDKSDTLGTDKVGYRSRHFIATLSKQRTSLGEFKKFEGIRFEIQVRTILQHAWAEIEHDRNYKYGGVLPSEIQRCFNLLAGSLELVDDQFEQLSNRIEKYSADVVAMTKTGNLNIPINSMSVIQYLSQKFGDLITITSLNNEQSFFMIDELDSMEIEYLSDLEKILPVNLKQLAVAYKDHNYLSFVRLILILHDPKKYFEQAWNEHFTSFAKEYLQLLHSFGLNIEELQQQIPNGTILREDGSLDIGV